MLKYVTLLLCLVSVTFAAKCFTINAADENYWTPERMASAIPRDMMFPGNVTVKDPTAFACIPYTIRLINSDLPRYRTYPLGSVGKVFFTLSGTNYVCSGSIGNNRMVWTAGHCVFERLSATTARWATSWMFVPGYANNDRPWGNFNAFTVCTSDEFEANGWNTNGIAYDYAVGVYQPNTFQPPTFVPFDLEVVSNPAQRQYQSNGYPQASPFNGAWNNQCESAGCIRATGLNGPQPVGMSCSSTGGSSGGPWLVPASANTWHIAGVNSFKYTNDNDNMYTSYFDQRTKVFYDDVVRQYPTN